MTPQQKDRPGTERLLDEILERIASIDGNVEEILNRLDEHLDDIKYRSWYDHSLHNGHGYD